MTQAKPSKTERKRQHLELQELGERMIGMDARVLDELPLDDRLRDAVRAAASMRGRGALRRQKQLIGKLMRNADAGAIHAALDARAADDRVAKRIFANAERWRDRIAGGDAEAIAEFAAASGGDSSELADLVSELHSSRSDKQTKTLRRRLFRLIHDALVMRARDDRIPR